MLILIIFFREFSKLCIAEREIKKAAGLKHLKSADRCHNAYCSIATPNCTTGQPAKFSFVDQPVRKIPLGFKGETAPKTSQCWKGGTATYRIAPNPAGMGHDGSRKKVISVTVVGCSTIVTAFVASTSWKSKIAGRPGITTPNRGVDIYLVPLRSEVPGTSERSDGSNKVSDVWNRLQLLKMMVLIHSTSAVMLDVHRLECCI